MFQVYPGQRLLLAVKQNLLIIIQSRLVIFNHRFSAPGVPRINSKKSEVSITIRVFLTTMMVADFVFFYTKCFDLAMYHDFHALFS